MAQSIFSFLKYAMLLFPLVLSATATETKSFCTKDGTKYVYEYSAAAKDSPTVLLVHGYPSSRHDWRYQIANLTAAGYGVLAADSLGYGDSDKPTEVEAYRLKRLAGHFTELFDSEGLETVIGVAHDWGSIVLSYTAAWHPERFEKLAFLSAGYNPPGGFFDIDAINALGIKENGYARFGYWYFMNSYNSADLIRDNIESAFHLCYPSNNSAWGEDLGDIGAARAWLTANKTTPLPSYLTEEDKQAWIKQYSRPNATTTSMNYYKAFMRGVNVEDDKGLEEEALFLNVPVLTIGGTVDMLLTAEDMGRSTEPYAKAGYTERTVDAGHWLMLEKREEVNAIFLEFFES